MRNGECFFSSPFYGHQHANKKSEIEGMKLMTTVKRKIAQKKNSQTSSQISEVREIFDEAVEK